MSAQEDKVTLWIAGNRGKLSEIARKAKVSPQFVQMVLRGRRHSAEGNVERELKRAGAPVK